MKYVILGSSAAGINAGRELRTLDSHGEITMISRDSEIYSRCILHHYLGEVRTVEQLSFAEADYFERFSINFLSGRLVTGLNTESKTVSTDQGDLVPYDKLLIATGSSSFIPPIQGIEGTKNHVGFRNLEDIEKMKNRFPCQHIVVLGAGLVGLDCISGLLELGIKPTLVETAPHLLMRQLDAQAAQPYADALSKRGVTQFYNEKVDKVISEQGRITALQLSSGETIPCNLLVVAAGVHANIAFLADTSVETDSHGLVFDVQGRTNVPDIFGAGDVSGLRPIWPVAVKEGIIAAHNMAGGSMEATDFFASKSTMNFCGIATIALGDVNQPYDDCQVEVLQEGNTYKKIIHKDGKILAAILQNDLAYSGILQQLIIHKIDVRHVKKPLFQIDYSDFFQVDETFDYFY